MKLFLAMICFVFMTQSYAAESTRILYVRHGEVPGNNPSPSTWIYTGSRTDEPLTEKGRLQAKQCAEEISQFEVTAIYASDLKRAAETAQAIGNKLGLPVELRHDLREIDWGCADGQLVEKIDEQWGALEKEVRERYPDRKERWDHLPVFEGAETYNAVLKRSLAEIKTIAGEHKGETIVVVSHGRVFKTLLAVTDAGEKAVPYLPNCGIAEFTYSAAEGLQFVKVYETTPSESLPKRSQEPKEPYPYDTEEVHFENRSAGISLAGTLTLPRSKGPFPVVILLHGSAPLDRDSALFGHKPFLIWADHLTRQGIAVLRFDKRSVGKSTGSYSTATLEDFASDALAAAAYLKTRKEIDVKKIGFIGHSEGGMTAALAASRLKEIAFVVLLASPCVGFEELICNQETLLQRADGVSEEMITYSRRFRRQIFAILKREQNREAAATEMREAFTVYLNKLSPAQRTVAESYYGTAEEQIQFFNSTWLRYSIAYEPTIALKQLTIPVLALNGDLDFIVSTEQNLQRIAKACEEVGHKDYTAIELPKLNHMLQTCQSGSLAECAAIDETVAPLALETVSQWILKRSSDE